MHTTLNQKDAMQWTEKILRNNLPFNEVSYGLVSVYII